MDISQVLNNLQKVNSTSEGTKGTKQKNKENEKFSLEVKKVQDKYVSQKKESKTENKVQDSDNLIVKDEEDNILREDVNPLLELLSALLINKEGVNDNKLLPEFITTKDIAVEPLLKLLGINPEVLQDKLKGEEIGKEILSFLKDEGSLDTLLLDLNVSKDSLQGQEIISKLQNLKNIVENNSGNFPEGITKEGLLKELISEANKVNSSKEVPKENENKLQIPVNNTPENTGNEKGTESNQLLSKEEALLEKLTKTGEGEEKLTRVNNFISILNNNIDNLNPSKIEEPLVMTKSNINNDVIKALTYMDQNGIKDLTVKIYPRELGQVTISVVMEQGALKAMIKANSKEAVDILAAGLGEINDKISSQNIKIESVNISLYEQDTTYFKDEQRSFSENNNNSNDNEKKVQGEIELEEETASNANPSSTLNILI